MRIIALQSENVKRLRAVSIKPDGSMVVIKGQNGAGKSSVLDSIAYALGGEKLCPPEVIRRGQESAEVTLDLGDFIVTRRWTAGGSTLAVKSREGARYPSPQTILDKLVGKLSFDPLAFTRAKPVDQVETLRKLVGLDFTIIDLERERLYDERTVVNREVAIIKGALARMPEVDAPDHPVSVAELLSEQEKRLTVQKKIEDAQRAAKEATRKREQAHARVKESEERIAMLERQLSTARGQLTADTEAFVAAEQAEDAAGGACMQLEAPDLDGIRAQLREAEGTNEKVRAKKVRAIDEKKLAAKEADSKDLTTKIEAVDARKAASLADAQFPVEGLSFTDDGVTLNSLPLEQASAAEQLRVSIAIGAALNPKLRVILVRDGSLLDEKSLVLLAETAERLNLQVWVERVSGGREPGVVIEDGQVQESLPMPAEVAPNAT